MTFFFVCSKNQCRFSNIGPQTVSYVRYFAYAKFNSFGRHLRHEMRRTTYETRSTRAWATYKRLRRLLKQCHKRKDGSSPKEDMLNAGVDDAWEIQSETSFDSVASHDAYSYRVWSLRFTSDLC